MVEHCVSLPLLEDVEHCKVPCSIDCQLSLWTQWSDCSTSSGSGFQERLRFAEHESSNGGKLCPDEKKVIFNDFIDILGIIMGVFVTYAMYGIL